MSLDLYIISKKPVKHNGTGIYIRVNGQNKELTYEEVNKLYPNTPVDNITTEDNIFWHSNITHNLGKMTAQCICECPNKVSLYQLLWRPEEIDLLGKGGILTSSYIKALSICLNDLKEHKDFYEKFNPDNGWGNYDSLVNFTESFVNAVNKIPQDKYNEYIVEASR